MLSYFINENFTAQGKHIYFQLFSKKEQPFLKLNYGFHLPKISFRERNKNKGTLVHVRWSTWKLVSYWDVRTKGQEAFVWKKIFLLIYRV